MRLGWDEYFMSIAWLVSQRSTCLRRKVGAVLILDKRILATGYNGAPSGLEHCLDLGCLRQQLNVPSGTRHEICRALHAEQNLLLQAAQYGITIANSANTTIYCTNYPCSFCAKMLINVGIKKVVYADDYPDDLAKEFFESAKIITQKLDFSALETLQKLAEKQK